MIVRLCGLDWKSCPLVAGSVVSLVARVATPLSLVLVHKITGARLGWWANVGPICILTRFSYWRSSVFCMFMCIWTIVHCSAGGWAQL